MTFRNVGLRARGNGSETAAARCCPDPLALRRAEATVEALSGMRRPEDRSTLLRLVPDQKKKVPQGGVLRLPSQRRELLFVTLDKSGAGFSPTTRYRDYAISRDLFHHLAHPMPAALFERYATLASG